MRPDAAHPGAQFAIRRHHGGAAGRDSDQRHDRVVTAARSVHDLDAIARPLGRRTPGLALEDHDEGDVERARRRALPEPLDQPSRRAGPVPPPPVRSGPDHVGRVDDEHRQAVSRAHVPPAGPYLLAFWQPAYQSGR